ncbi:MAG: DUF1501 domain-containing protein [Acidobacteriia bacterium]|nr:DUF1501 domain-containing protein [Terriglobia bacterium]MYB53277.1 DUF1501 domain-containing protein [Terriglobia bacterium]MYC66061.1 DUF1501 domain-containing protein [Terriglobia bacterium]MYG01239.1 DUF1501 domain-containing protein [Terriglobia bacterium]MYK11539.1 DUF1501 domain-containing protein [Terriglobia bacterium]
MNLHSFNPFLSRRDFLDNTLYGLGLGALSHLLGIEGRTAEPDALAPRKPHFAPRAKNVIFLFQAGAPSQIDLFDPKPKLHEWNGQPLPESLAKQLQLAFIQPTAKVLASRRQFQPAGQSGIELSEWLPHTATIADELCLVRSVRGDSVNHHPGQSLLMTGNPLPGRPTVGSWITYGLGSESRDLPGFVVLKTGSSTQGSTGNWTNGFLPSNYQGVLLRSEGDAILHLSNPAGVTSDMQRADLDLIRELNLEQLARTGDQEIAARIASYELAFRMQASAPSLIDVSDEPERTREMYGLNSDETRDYGMTCLLARRLIERGVRFVLNQHAQWDHHSNLDKGLSQKCRVTDKPVAALVKDLKQRGLLDETLVIWAGEFGRTSLAEWRNPSDPANIGRDHHADGFSVWMAGGGIKGGQVIGSTDELGLTVEDNPVHVHDLQATVLHCLGLDHERLTYRHAGRDFRLTDVGGTVVESMLA